MHDEHGLLTLLKYIQPYIEMQRHLGAHRVSDYSIDVEKKPLSLELLFKFSLTLWWWMMRLPFIGCSGMIRPRRGDPILLLDK